MIKFLSDKPLCGHIPDPFPPCGIGSGYARQTLTCMYIFMHWPLSSILKQFSKHGKPSVVSGPIATSH